jgi:hypothetical protein
MTAAVHHTTVARVGVDHWHWRCPHCAYGRCHTWVAAYLAAYLHTRNGDTR